MNNLERVKKVISETAFVDLDSIEEDSSLVDDLGLDSLERTEIMMELEKEFNITIPDDSTENMITVGHVLSKINELTGD